MYIFVHIYDKIPYNLANMQIEYSFKREFEKKKKKNANCLIYDIACSFFPLILPTLKNIFFH